MSVNLITNLRYKLYMTTINQKVKGKKYRYKLRCNVILKGKPQKKGSCLKVFEISPKKPNSAKRKIAKIKFKNMKRNIFAYIPGIGHNLQEHSTVLIRGGKTQDLPGLKFKIIRGKYDASPVVNRITGRSKYGEKKPKEEEDSKI